ncbi:hypothetical protein [Cytobacillus gottheilii]|uniref:hypothetical protein n=1 Tax=Cytobacillus gottheilii TaxID=859144 RepID=UPI0024947E32|nr:hypothetical protein [Cytobacillus gottheilii]
MCSKLIFLPNREGSEKQVDQGSDRTSTGTYIVREKRSERADAEIRRLSISEPRHPAPLLNTQLQRL